MSVENAPEKASSSTDADSIDSSVVCPTCGRDDFKKPGDMKLHHYHTHGESIAKETVVCDWCGETRQEYPANIDRYEHFFCDLSCKAEWESENKTGENNVAWKGGKVDVECAWCGDVRKMYPSIADGQEHHFCPDTDCIGKWLSKKFEGEKSARWKGGYSRYNNGWCAARRKALERDNHTCQDCGKHAEELERNPHVHHIRPVRTFDNVDNAHDLNNLVVLCGSCHPKWEGLYLRPDTRGVYND